MTKKCKCQHVKSFHIIRKDKVKCFGKIGKCKCKCFEEIKDGVIK
jgi:hypothetical protein